ncbi:MAG: glycine cleavage system protein H [Desulfobulbus propionicus]|nr:MAG: glycine cleavage system protein H [Desulfobulbus propionicus]
MKELDELQIPEELRYTEEHEWAKFNGETVRIGVTDYAQDQLGDIVFVELPAVGDRFSQGDECGTLESVKAVSEFYLPMGGEVLAVNTELENSPELLNQDPYTNWLIEIKPDNSDAYKDLLSASAYLAMLKGQLP